MIEVDVGRILAADLDLDVVRAVKESTHLRVAAYQVSGEYAQIHAAAPVHA